MRTGYRLRYFLGIDGGGSKCDAVLLDEEGTVLGWGRGGATNYRPTEDCAASVCQAVTAAIGETGVRELWVAHTWMAQGLREWLAGAGITVQGTLRVQEWEIAYLTAGRTWGVAVHSGTGSWVQIRTPDGRRPRIGGMGPFVGDEGSGWDIGFRGIKAALRSGWAKKTRTSLARAVPQAMGVVNLLEAVVGQPITTGKITRAQIAAIAPIVFREALAGDAVAMQIVDDAASALAEMCILLLDDTEVVGQGYPLIGAAGVIQNSPLYWRLLREKIVAHDPTLVPEVAPFKMAVGAAMLAMKGAGVPVTETVRARIMQTQSVFPLAVVPTLQSQD